MTSPLESVLHAIYSKTGKRPTGVGTSGGPYSARCPAHHDHKPSLVISQGEARVVLCCHAGCSEEEVLRALGLELKDLLPDKSLATVKKVVKRVALETESRPTKHLDLYEQTKVWIDGLPEDYSGSRDEYLDG